MATATTAGPTSHEEFAADLDGQPVEARELAMDHGGRTHVLACPAGLLTVRYRAALTPALPGPSSVTEAESLVALRQSRYCPSDLLENFAAAELGVLGDLADLTDAPKLARAIGDWVFERLQYEPGSSDQFDTAIDTLLAGRGVCRDFAHLTIALCRAVGLPARLASVYAPGITPMDFHAVVEVAVDGRWAVIDATKLAPRQSLVRVATGRDAADTAFATTLTGTADLVSSSAFAVTDRDLPSDDHQSAVVLP